MLIEILQFHEFHKPTNKGDRLESISKKEKSPKETQAFILD